MKKFILSFILLVLIIPFFTSAAVRVSGYYRSNGTYVQPHYRSNPDGNPYNNYSYPGNYNPYTGKTATGNSSTYLNNYYNSYTYPTYTPSYSPTPPSYPSYVPTYSPANTSLSSPSQYYIKNKTCVGIAEKDFGDCVTYAYNH